MEQSEYRGGGVDITVCTHKRTYSKVKLMLQFAG